MTGREEIEQYNHFLNIQYRITLSFIKEHKMDYKQVPLILDFCCFFKLSS